MMINHIFTHMSSHRGYKPPAYPETDSDGDGGAQPKLRGLGLTELSPKGIPHASVHVTEQVKWAGHLFMFDTCAPEASHKETIKVPMDRVRKLGERKTASSMMDWTLRTRTWRKIITLVNSVFGPLKGRRKSKPPASLTVYFARRNIHSPGENVRSSLWSNTFSPLIKGGDNLLTPDVRVRYSYMFKCDCNHMVFMHGITHGIMY